MFFFGEAACAALPRVTVRAADRKTADFMGVGSVDPQRMNLFERIAGPLEMDVKGDSVLKSWPWKVLGKANILAVRLPPLC